MISRLLSHFWTADDPEPARQAQIEDWIGDLIEFGAETASRACAEWRRGQSQRPTIADIRKLCIDERASRQPLIGGNSRDGLDAYVQSLGYASMKEHDTAAREYQAQQTRILTEAEEWRNSAEGRRHIANAHKAWRSMPALGVIVREFCPSAEALAAGRRALGLEPEEAA